MEPGYHSASKGALRECPMGLISKPTSCLHGTSRPLRVATSTQSPARRPREWSHAVCRLQLDPRTTLELGESNHGELIRRALERCRVELAKYCGEERRKLGIVLQFRNHNYYFHSHGEYLKTNSPSQAYVFHFQRQNGHRTHRRQGPRRRHCTSRRLVREDPRPTRLQEDALLHGRHGQRLQR